VASRDFEPEHNTNAIPLYNLLKIVALQMSTNARWRAMWTPTQWYWWNVVLGAFSPYH
jgi:hypothetical protein